MLSETSQTQKYPYSYMWNVKESKVIATESRMVVTTGLQEKKQIGEILDIKNLFGESNSKVLVYIVVTIVSFVSCI